MSASRLFAAGTLVALVGVAANLGPMASVAAAEPPPPPPPVSLSAEHTAVKVSETIHLTATTTENVGPTPYSIKIFDADTHTEVARCGSGTECTASIPIEWAENEYLGGSATRHYYAEVSGGSEGLYTRSGEVTITVEPYVFTVSLTSTASSVTIPESYTLKATSSANVGPTPYSIRIIENGTNKEVARCGSGTECTGTIEDPWSENGEIHDRTYHAVVSDSTYTAGSSDSVSVAVFPFFFTVSLSISYDHSEEREGHTVVFDKALATTNRDVGPTPYHIAIHNEGGVEVARCGSGTECTATVEAGHTYTADVENGEGKSFGAPTASNLSVAGLAGLYGAGSDICTALVTYPYGTHLAGSSLSDQELACEAAVRAGATTAGVIAAIAATDAGGRALWWVLREGTEAQPGFERPKPSETEPYPVPTSTLPEVWPVAEAAASLKANNAAAELTETQAQTIALRCLWNAAEADLDGASECERLPIFASGSDVPSATEHDLNALASNPSWVRLNYESGAAKEEHGASREWYRERGGCAGETPEGKSCDEYPFFASQQGGPDASPAPSLEYIDAADNSKQGSQYGGFVTACKLSEGTPFLVVAIPPSAGIPTTRLCN